MCDRSGCGCDTIRREKTVRERGLHFVGAGISGGEEGALNGPSITAGESAEAYSSLGFRDTTANRPANWRGDLLLGSTWGLSSRSRNRVR
jgi:6-phosphogluconate dehydrogenase (decarboxylating)